MKPRSGLICVDEDVFIVMEHSLADTERAVVMGPCIAMGEDSCILWYYLIADFPHPLSGLYILLAAEHRFPTLVRLFDDGVEV